MSIIRIIIVCVLLSISSFNGYSQKYQQRRNTPTNRAYIKQCISEWGSCRNVAITSYGGDIALNANNAWACTAIPSGLESALKELNKKGEFIDDVQLTEKGSWLVLYGDNGFQWYNIPVSLEYKMREFNRKGEVITSVTFNDRGDWIIISNKLISSSSDKLQDELKRSMEIHGQLWAAHLTNNALALCFSKGYQFLGDVPLKLKEALRKSNLDVFRIKFTEDGSYFFADKDGNYEAWM